MIDWFMNGSKKKKQTKDPLRDLFGIKPSHRAKPKSNLINNDFLQGFIGQGHPNPKDKKTKQQKAFLHKTRIGTGKSHLRFYDLDGDGVIAGLDCQPFNYKRHGFFTKATNWARGRGFQESEESVEVQPEEPIKQNVSPPVEVQPEEPIKHDVHEPVNIPPLESTPVIKKKHNLSTFQPVEDEELYHKMVNELEKGTYLEQAKMADKIRLQQKIDEIKNSPFKPLPKKTTPSTRYDDFKKWELEQRKKDKEQMIQRIHKDISKKYPSLSSDEISKNISDYSFMNYIGKYINPNSKYYNPTLYKRIMQDYKPKFVRGDTQ